MSDWLILILLAVWMTLDRCEIYWHLGNQQSKLESTPDRSQPSAEGGE